MSDIAKTSVGLMKVGGSRAYHFTLRLDGLESVRQESKDCGQKETNLLQG